jgi:FixJ family two-component response regulator
VAGKGEEGGALAYFKKPFGDQSLIDAIHSALGKGPESRKEKDDKPSHLCFLRIGSQNRPLDQPRGKFRWRYMM